MLGTYYSILMMIVVVGTIVRVVDGSWKTTAVLFLLIMAVIFFLIPSISGFTKTDIASMRFDFEWCSVLSVLISSPYCMQQFSVEK